MKIAFLIIGTKNYLKLAQDCAASLKEFVRIAGATVDTVIFTDHPHQHDGNHYKSVPHLPWPLTTLLRYNHFVNYQNSLAAYDYLYYIDADMRAVSLIGEEILGNLVTTLHPGFYNRPKSHYTYERNPISTAAIPINYSGNYYIGAFQGGSSSKFLSMCRCLSENINKDLYKNYIAVWHDESHMNRYAAENAPDVILDPSYCYPEKWNLPEFTPKIVAVDKDQLLIRSEVGTI